MRYESIQSILFALTAVILLIKIIRTNYVQKEAIKYLISSLLLTIVLLSAIVFKIHHLLRSAFNIPNTMTYLAVSLFFIYYLIRFRTRIISSHYILLIISLVLLLIGGFTDLLGDAEIISISGLDLLEEIFNAAGALFWLLFFFRLQSETGAKSS